MEELIKKLNDLEQFVNNYYIICKDDEMCEKMIDAVIWYIDKKANNTDMKDYFLQSAWEEATYPSDVFPKDEIVEFVTDNYGIDELFDDEYIIEYVKDRYCPEDIINIENISLSWD